MIVYCKLYSTLHLQGNVGSWILLNNLDPEGVQKSHTLYIKYNTLNRTRLKYIKSTIQIQTYSILYTFVENVWGLLHLDQIINIVMSPPHQNSRIIKNNKENSPRRGFFVLVLYHSVSSFQLPCITVIHAYGLTCHCESLLPATMYHCDSRLWFNMSL